VKQGDILSPLLFNIFVNDMISLFNESDSFAPSLVQKEVGSLMYADDLVILSTSKTGLQSSMNKLNTYCHRWKLAINFSKSKIMCFSKQGRYSKDEFMIQNQKIEEVKSYAYLGIEMSNNGNFAMAQKSLNNKALRALFKLKKLTFGTKLKPFVLMKLFDQLIKPICLYGSEIWGPMNLNIADSLENDGKLETSLEKFLCEKLNMSFSKYVLGVHKRSQNSAVRGELGRPPLGLDILSAIVRYRLRLELSAENSILKEAYELSNSNTNKKKCWGPSSKHLTSFITKHARLDEYTLLNKKMLKRFLRSNYIKQWQEKIQGESKMRTYITFKSNFEYESYLNMANEDQRKSMTRFRISAHRLAIERGRYTVPPTPANNRLCIYCTSQEVEDEYHFLMSCNKYQQLRETLKANIQYECENFNNLQEEEQFVYMLIAGDTISNHVSAYINDAFSQRKDGVACNV